MSASSEKSSGSIARGHPGLVFATLTLGSIAQVLVFAAPNSALPEMAKDLREAAAVIKRLSRTVYELAHAYVKAE